MCSGEQQDHAVFHQCTMHCLQYMQRHRETQRGCLDTHWDPRLAKRSNPSTAFHHLAKTYLHAVNYFPQIISNCTHAHEHIHTYSQTHTRANRHAHTNALTKKHTHKRTHTQRQNINNTLLCAKPICLYKQQLKSADTENIVKSST